MPASAEGIVSSVDTDQTAPGALSGINNSVSGHFLKEGQASDQGWGVKFTISKPYTLEPSTPSASVHGGAALHVCGIKHRA